MHRVYFLRFFLCKRKFALNFPISREGKFSCSNEKVSGKSLSTWMENRGGESGEIITCFQITYISAWQGQLPLAIIPRAIRFFGGISSNKFVGGPVRHRYIQLVSRVLWGRSQVFLPEGPGLVPRG